MTFILVAPGLRNGHFSFLASNVTNADSVATPGWTIGSGLYYCKDHEFKVQQQPSDSLIVALKNLPAGSMDMVSLFAESGRYGIAVIEGYLTSNPAIGADRLEENDNCELADRVFADPATRIDLTAPFSEALTIDNPHDVDWIRFRVPGTVTQAVTFKTAPPAGGTGRGDIDLYVLGVPVAGSPLDIRGSSNTVGSSESLTVLLEPGEYYIVVTDFAGVPMNYSLCAARGTSCSPAPGFMTSAAPSPVRSATAASGP